VVAPAAEVAKPTAAVDLMAALQASVDRAKAARGETPSKPATTKHAAPTPITHAKSAKKAAADAASEPPAKKAAPAAKKAAAAKKAPAKAAAPAAKKAAPKKAPAKARKSA
jgi:DNA end-binding protein Ku